MKGTPWKELVIDRSQPHLIVIWHGMQTLRRSDTRSCLMQCLFARSTTFLIRHQRRSRWLGCNSVTATPPVAIARVKLIKLERPFEPRPGTDSSRMTLISRGLGAAFVKQEGEGYA